VDGAGEVRFNVYSGRRRRGTEKEVTLKSVRQVLNDKGYAVETIAPEATVYEALQKMANKEVGALVVQKDGEICGLFSERDYARKVILQGKHSKDTKVEEIMTRRVITLEPQQTVEACMVVMTDKRIRHLPVVEEGRLIGIVSIGDIVKAVIETQQLTIEELESYITGRR
jgi:CBS domain-containing protein